MGIGEIIRKKRTEMRFSQREIASFLGLKDHTMLAKIESGLRLPRSSVPSFARWLGIEEDELLRLIIQEKAEKIDVISEHIKKPPFLPMEKIEEIALKDRKRYLRTIGVNNNIKFPEDREKIVRVLFGLKVYYEDHLFGPIDERLYGGLFPKGCYYHGDDKVIVINTHRLKGEGLVSEETKTFQIFHEAGHYRLHFQEGAISSPLNLPPDRPVYCNAGSKYKPLEFQANAYATAFLVPQIELKEELIGLRTSVNFRKFEKILRQKFGVSKKTLLYRFKSLGLKVWDEREYRF
jgi:Zn-dependent peptidase ImmA (M78 family)/transcriptional regulator with XRE-family HTH domain